MYTDNAAAGRQSTVHDVPPSNTTASSLNGSDIPQQQRLDSECTNLAPVVEMIESGQGNEGVDPNDRASHHPFIQKDEGRFEAKENGQAKMAQQQDLSSRSGPELTVSATNLDLDLNEDRKKRRRTGSPGAGQDSHFQSGWQEQPKDSGFEGSSSKPTYQAETVETASPAKCGSEATPTPSNRVTPPRKMMKLRTDGRLVSPKAKDEETTKRRRKRKNGKEDPKGPGKVLVLSYGREPDSRQRMGNMIRDVLSGKLQLASISQHGSATTEVPLKLTAPSKPTTNQKPAYPPKPTHPFFLGKPKLEPKPEQTHPSKISDSNSTPFISASGRQIGGSPRKKNIKWSINQDGHESAPSISSGQTVLGRRFPGTKLPLWPPKDMTHVRGSPLADSKLPGTQSAATHSSARKLKEPTIQLAEDDDVLSPFRQLSSDLRTNIEQRHFSKGFHKPCRKVMSGKDLQCTIEPLLASKHPAILRLLENLKSSSSPFDRFECENEDWVHKYAPKHFAQVLQDEDRLSILREWLFSQAVLSVESGKKSSNHQPLNTGKPIKPKKKRRRTSDLDDFVVSGGEGSFDEEDPMDADDSPLGIDAEKQAVASRTGIRHNSSLRKLTSNSLPKTRAVIVSGPHGCGKTASVYAIAQELDFEVFEINASSRRSGRDLLDKIGDMTKNHLVHHSNDPWSESIDLEEMALDTQKDIDSGRQSTMQSFFTSKSKGKAPKRQSKPEKSPQESPRKKRQQKQSLVFLEEVDVLFEEDRQFWNTVVTLLINSKRPIIMTCTDENLIPSDDLHACAVLRLSSAEVDLATDYLLLVAANEGHLLSPDALRTLFTSKNMDLRASMAELNFWCQMAIGDEKGGLDWMLTRSETLQTPHGETEGQRVVSEDTYAEYMGILGGEQADDTSHMDIDECIDALIQATEGWNYDANDWTDFIKVDSIDVMNEHSPKRRAHLSQLELAYDALSAADIMPGSSLLEPMAVSISRAFIGLANHHRYGLIHHYPDLLMQQEATLRKGIASYKQNLTRT